MSEREILDMGLWVYASTAIPGFTEDLMCPTDQHEMPK